jgi:hypothetical protein
LEDGPYGFNEFSCLCQGAETNLFVEIDFKSNALIGVRTIDSETGTGSLADTIFQPRHLDASVWQIMLQPPKKKHLSRGIHRPSRTGKTNVRVLQMHGRVFSL